jgi:ribosomal protein S18 acetylase RimI-like enzyme
MVEIRPFTEDLVGEAARLLEERHRRHRAAEPLLPDRPDYAGEVRALWEKGASGTVALRGGEVVGYVLGTRLADEVWGLNVWVELAGHAVVEAEDARDLYAEAAARWVQEGRRAHYALVPASDAALVDAWFRLGFGQQHALGVRELDATTVAAAPDGVTVRKARQEDVDALVALAPLLRSHQTRSPVFSAGPPGDSEEELRTEISADIENERLGILVAEVDGRIVSNFDLVPIAESSMHSGLARVPGAALLGWAATTPAARGTGAGLALAAASFAWAREHGYTAMVTDWRVTNLLASRFWTRRGFRPTFLRLHRLLDVG